MLSRNSCLVEIGLRTFKTLTIKGPVLSMTGLESSNLGEVSRAGVAAADLVRVGD